MTTNLPAKTHPDLEPIDLRLNSHGIDLSALCLPNSPEGSHEPRQLTMVLEDLLPRLYLASDQLPYHGLPHPGEVRTRALELAAALIERGIPVNVAALEQAALLHDLWYQLDPKQFGFDSKEKLALCVGYTILLMLGATDQHATYVAQIIAATHADGPLELVEQQIIRAADLAGFISNYSTFKLDSADLLEEQRRLSGMGPNAAADMLLTRVLPRYLWPQIALTEGAFDSQERSHWHLVGMTNIITWFKKLYSDAKVVLDIVDTENPEKLSGPDLGPAKFTVTVSNDDNFRREGVTRGQLQLTARNNGEPHYYVPGSVCAIPLPDGSCDRINIAGMEIPELTEVQRVLRKDGMIVFKLAHPGLEVLDYRVADAASVFRDAGFKVESRTTKQENGQAVTEYQLIRR